MKLNPTFEGAKLVSKHQWKEAIQFWFGPAVVLKMS